MAVLWLVVARSGSKGIPDKNIQPVGGIPLLAWSILAARTVGGTVWLSTDSLRYAEIGKAYGAEIPFLRPKHLSTDTASSADVCLHALDKVQKVGKNFDVVGMLQPTSPFIRAASLRHGLQVLRADETAHAAVAVKHAHPSSMLIQPDGPYLDVLAERFALGKDYCRQSLPREITPCGGFYLALIKRFLKLPTFYAPTTVPIILDEVEAIDIDSPMDLMFADFLVNVKGIKPEIG